MTSLLTFLAKGAALWVVAGLLTTLAWVCAVVWWQVLAAEDEVSLRRFREMNEKIEALPGWVQAFAESVQRATFAVGLSPRVGAIIADVSSFIVGWPWVAGLVAEILYEWWNGENNGSGEGRGDQ